MHSQVEGSKASAPKKKKPSMTMGESFRYLAGSPYIRDLALLVIAYGMSINIVEVPRNRRRGRRAVHDRRGRPPCDRPAQLP